MTTRMRVRRADLGLSLIETVAAVFIFSVITVGIVPLLASAMKGANLTRGETVAKNVARHAMERVRGIQYYVSYDAKPNKRVDILDLYYPQSSGSFLSGQSYSASATNSPLNGTGGVFSTQCPPLSGTNPACPPDIPEGYTLTFTASFVRPNTTTTPESYDIVTPAADYSWNTQGKDTPATDLVDLKVAVAWNQGSSNETFALRSIIGKRTFRPVGAVDAGPSPSPSQSGPPAPGGLRLQGRADLDYAYQVTTGFSSGTAQPSTGCPTAPCKSELIGTVGTSRSNIETQTLSTANQETRYGTVRVVRTYPSGTTPPDPPPADLSTMTGAVSVASAPPVSAPADVTLPTSPLSWLYATHPDLSNAQVAAFSNSQVYGVRADVTNELPVAEGYFKTAATTIISEPWFQNTQADFSTSHLRLMNGDTANRLVQSTRESESSSNPIKKLVGYTTARTGALGAADRRVETTAHAEIDQLRVLRYQFTSQVTGYIVLIQNFTATAQCKSTADGGTAIASVSWKAHIQYTRDTTADNKINPTGALLTTEATTYTSGNPLADPSATIGAGAGKTNYLVYDPSGTTSDLWLFDDPAQGRKGYLESWSLNTAPTASKSADGRTTSATLDAAIRVDTAQMNPTIPESTYNVSVGKLSCEAVDNR